LKYTNTKTRMPGAKTHIIFGFIFALIVASIVFYINKKLLIFDYWLFLAIIPAVFLGSIICDIDMKNSMIVWILMIISVIAIIVSLSFIGFDFYKEQAYRVFYYSLVLLILSVICPVVFAHRGFTHSLTFGLLLSSTMIYLHWIIAIAFFIGFLSHIFADCHLSLF